ncbi:tetratricopeptide repeat protein [Deinococcus peraridilitoris]|uniref:Putative transcriptional regulator n=1 Tax=Deinococcus peraridilitoris (strain DSM 19664 / LMG 22246 / CIP 109416 / KR-200) TaxID=937777 RepID=L0A3P0_DEIPD|nr:tetratricopeptide repeat protein [Deinococcus peraridilitoris]AFZ67605.1 putative transcriptional regulator [Deinococcus peraridilitoris DSM 19664]
MNAPGKGRTVKNISSLGLACLLGLSFASVADAQTTLRAWSDSSALPPLAEHERRIAELSAGCVDEVDVSPSSPTLRAGGLPIEDAIRELEKRLAQMQPGSPGYAELERVLRELREQRKKSGGGAPGGPSMGASTDVTVTLERALEARVGRAAWTAFRSSVEVKSAERARGAAVVALARNIPEAALAALLAAHQLEPKNAAHLVNAAGVANSLGWAREALGLLKKAEALKPDPPSIMNIPGRAVLLNNKGHALLNLGRPRDAEAALREAVRLAPLLAEANTNLARALACQGKTAEAVKVFQEGMRRTPSAQAGKDHPVDTETPREGEAAPPLKRPEQSRLVRPAATVFDLSRGQNWTFPQAPLPRSLDDVLAMQDLYARIHAEGEARERALRAEYDALAARLRPRSPATTRRARDVHRAIATSFAEPGLSPLHKAAWDAHAQMLRAFDRGRRAAEEELERIPMDPLEVWQRECRRIYNGFLSDWHGRMMGQNDAIARYTTAAVQHKTAVAANVADAIQHQMLIVEVQLWAESMYYGTVAGFTWEYVTENLAGQALSCAATPGATISPEVAPKPSRLTFDPCPDALRGAKFGLSVGVASFGISCESFEMEVKTPSWIGAFANYSKGFNGGSSTVFFGVKADKSLGTAGVNVAASAAAGMYVRWGKKGLEDGGFRVAASAGASAGAGPVSYGKDYDLSQAAAALNVDFSVVSAVSYWTEEGT